MKIPLNQIEQNNLRSRGVLGQGEIAYRENNKTYAEDAISGEKRMIDSLSDQLKESKILLG